MLLLTVSSVSDSTGRQLDTRQRQPLLMASDKGQNEGVGLKLTPNYYMGLPQIKGEDT